MKMRIILVSTVGLTLVFAAGATASGDGDTPPTPAIDVSTSEPELQMALPDGVTDTTSEFGTSTEIEIALDDDGNIIPARP